MRFWPVLASLTLATVAAPHLAHADLAEGQKVKLELEIPKTNADAQSTNFSDYQKAADDDTSRRYFNKARCICDETVNGGKEQNYHVLATWETVPTPVPIDQLFVWTGAACQDKRAEDRPDSCKELPSIPNASALSQGVHLFPRVSELLAPGDDNDCDSPVTSTSLSVFTSGDGQSTLKLRGSVEPKFDLLAPEVPTKLEVVAVENAIRLEWDPISSTEDYAYFQALCSKFDGVVAHDTQTHVPQYVATNSICAVPPDEVKAATIANPDGFLAGATMTVPPDLLDLNDAYICGQEAGSAQSITLKGLDNKTEYWVVLLAIDKAGNYTARYVPSTIIPSPVTDLWEDLNSQNSELEGGFCLVESAFGGGFGGGSGPGGLYGALRAWRDDLRTTAAGRWMVDRYYAWGAPIAAAARASVVVRVVVALVLLPLVAIALLWQALSLPGLLALIAGLVVLRRRRRWSATRSRTLGLALAATIVLAPALAAAQSVSPYWDDSEPDFEPRVALPTWHLGLRVGPYWPSVDDKFNTDPGPYERMFDKGKGLLPMIGLHRLVSTRFGQFGGGLSAGYFGKDADAYRDGTMDGPDRPRAAGNRTAFRLVPIELTGIYRAAQIDDNWGIPVVPYLRGGLGYYAWWIRQPDGDISEICTTVDSVETCTDRGAGASLGLVGAAGLSIRAERIDPEAARSMRETGLEHAGFFAEVSTAWVDGFGSAKKLSLGDTTWSAGIDFEF